ncbi:MAG: transglutaminaseTgpA domain-containing protein [Actinomycetota bacterium]
MGSEARARLGLAALLLIVLYSFSQVFEHASYAGPAILGAIAATVLAMVCRRLGVSVFVTFLLSIAAMTWYLMVIFQAKKTLFGLPTLGAAGGLIKAAERAYAHSQVDFAPVQARPGYVILVVLAVWMLATIGEIATFRWRRPLMAVLGPLAMFSFVLIVGTNAGSAILVPLFLIGLLTYLGLESAHRLRSWGRWVATWRGRKATEPQAVTGGLARRMGAACVLVTLAAPLFLPSLGDGLLAWRNAVGNGTFGNGSGSGIGSSGEIDPLVSIVPEFLDQSDVELFRVRSSEPAYWKLVTLTEFDGEQWTPGSEPETPAPNGAIVSSSLPVPDPGRLVEQSFDITDLESRSLPAASIPAAVDITQTDLKSELEFNAETGDLELQTPVDNDFTYEVDSTVPDVSFREMQGAVVGDLDGRYEQVPAHDPEIDDLADQWTRGADTDFEQLLAIQNHLRNDFEYSTQVDREASSDYLHRFLTETRAGYCQQFATAFAILARLQGFPTRVGVGFLPGSASLEDPNEYIVSGTDAHAWPEVYFEGLGWVIFEPTPRGSAIPPGYTIEGGGVTGVGGSLRGPENRFLLPRGGRGPADLQGARDPNAGAVGDAGPTAEERRRQEWERRFATLTRVLVLALVLFLLAVPASKAWRIRRGYAQARDARQRATAAFVEFEREASELAFPRERSESAVAYARRVARGRRVQRGSAVRLATIFEAAQYALASIPAEESDEARILARDLKRSLWNGATWWDRALRLFSPLGLTGRL